MSAAAGEDRATRNAERTRAAVLAAAAEAIAERGTEVSLAYIATKAEVSKSGLLHHFPTRDALFVALVDDANQKMRAHITAHLDLAENTPGKMLRAYVRALCSRSEVITHYFTSAPVWAGVYRLPEVVRLSEEHARWLDGELVRDGLGPDLILVVQRAAEGVAAAHAYGELVDHDVEHAQDVLLALSCGSMPGGAL